MHTHTHTQPSPQEYVAAIQRYRQQKDDAFATSPDSPLPAELQAGDFIGLQYYPPNLAYRVVAELVVFDAPQTVPLGTTTGAILPQLRYGELTFDVMGEQCRLVAFTDPGAEDSADLFIPFRDGTSGGETYGAGRYLEAEDDTDEPSPRKVVLDFNLAYNPYCAYNADYSCPVPPPENRLAVPIMAGEMTFPVDH
jgi:uncharacterized protein (DUF1684 family)